MKKINLKEFKKSAVKIIELSAAKGECGTATYIGTTKSGGSDHDFTSSDSD